ncbi:ras-related protein Rab-18-like isoform X3 [Terrapene carolina triunguis]|uniref:ras-related protein Rab-18-like isoform X3 n=1 Tax=Terrapene triunguis TaxID=2587831 RepID=UPI001156877E|nr:ras-related protein Rab-18-like isoform X3 [Terrapene carolina triunguis]
MARSGPLPAAPTLTPQHQAGPCFSPPTGAGLSLIGGAGISWFCQQHPAAGHRRVTLSMRAARPAGQGLLLRFTDDTFEPYLNPTIGVDFKVKKMVVDGNPVQLAIWPDREINKREGLQFARKHSMLFIETSAKTRDGVQCAFEEVVIKILQTPGLWDKDKQKFGVQLETATHTEEDFCGGYCTLT